MSLIQDLKDRKITQITIGYVVAGWLVLSVFDQLVDRGVIPDVFYAVALTLFLFGVPVALIVGWYHGEKGAQKATVAELLQLSLIGVAAITTCTFVVRRHFQEAERQQLLTLESTLDLRRVAVTYFSADSEELEPFADGLTESLIRRLADVGELNVISTNGVAPYRGSKVSPDSIGRALDVGTVIEGRVSQTREDVRVMVRLLDAQSGVEIERIAPTWSADDLVSARRDLPVEVARQFREILGDELDLRQERASTSSEAAWLLVQRAKARAREARAARQAEDVPTVVRLYSTADEHLAAAAELDPDWVEPLIQRGWVQYGLARLSIGDLAQLGEHLTAATEYAEAAIQIDAASADALELRGVARYMLWFYGQRVPGLLADGVNPDALYRTARSDLEAAAGRSGHARAWNMLSNLEYQEGDLSAAVLAARRAYQEDPYLEAASEVLNRLWITSFDLDQYEQAEEWCAEGHDRFPTDYRFVQCQIWNMVMRAAEPEPETAWTLLDSMIPLIPPAQRDLQVRLTEIYVAGILGRAELTDSAEAVITRAREGATARVDAELVPREAAMWALMGNPERAVPLLEEYIVANPGHFSAERGLHWFWRSLEGEARFERLRQMN